MLKFKKVIVNGKFLTQRITGVQRYAREIVQELDNLVTSGFMEIAIPDIEVDVPIYKNIKVVKIGKTKNTVLWEQLSFPLYVKKEKGISLNLCNSSPLISPGIVCIHDVKIKAHPEFFSKKFLLWYNLLFYNAAKRAIKLLTVSNFSKKEIIKYYNVPADKILITPDSWQHFDRIRFNENTLEKYGLTKDSFYFAMSSFEPNKNFKWIADVATKNTDETFVIAGSINKRVFKEGLGFDCPSNMKLLGYVSDEEAKTLMRDCKAFLFPSIYEGFGMPPLEALSAGCKQIIVSDIEVMHEIFETNATFIDPIKFDILLDTVKNNQFEANKILSKYGWITSSKKLLHVLRSSMSSSR